MASPYSMFATSAALETSGIDVDYGDFKFHIARAGGANKRFATEMSLKMKPHRRAIQADSLDDDLGRKIMREVFVDTCLLGWEDVTDAEGKSIAFTRENALKLFTDLPDLFQDLWQQANNSALFRLHLAEQDAKN